MRFLHLSADPFLLPNQGAALAHLLVRKWTQIETYCYVAGEPLFSPKRTMSTPFESKGAAVPYKYKE